MNSDITIILTVVVVVGSNVATWFAARHKLKEYVRDQNEDIRKDIVNLWIRLEQQKSRDDLQQQSLDELGKQMSENIIPRLFKVLEDKKPDNEA